MKRNVSASGIVLSKKNYSETDRIIQVFSSEFGKMSVLAKGVRSPKSRKRGHLELFNHIKFSAQKSGNFLSMTEVENIEAYPEIRKSLKKLTVAYYFAEVVEKLTSYGEKNERILSLLKSYLTDLESVKSLKQLRLRFVYEILVTTGFLSEGVNVPDIDKFLEEVLERKSICVPGRAKGSWIKSF